MGLVCAIQFDGENAKCMGLFELANDENAMNPRLCISNRIDVDFESGTQ